MKMDSNISSSAGMHKYIYPDFLLISSKKPPCPKPLRPIFESEERISER